MVADNSPNDNTVHRVPYSNIKSENRPDDDDDETDIAKIIHPGYRFCPFDYELVGYYLKRKITNQRIPKNRIFEVNIYEKNPEELSAAYKRDGEKECYFFTKRDKKYKNGSRPNRAAGSGYWKATGADKDVKDPNNNLLGSRKALVFYRGKPPHGYKTNWIMHEFRVSQPPPHSRRSADDMTLDDCVLCRIYEKVDKGGNRNRPHNGNGEQEVEEVEDEIEPEVDEHVQQQDHHDVVGYPEFEGMDVAPEPMESYSINHHFGDYQTNMSYAYLTDPVLPPPQMDHHLPVAQNSYYYGDFGMGSSLPAPPPVMNPNTIFTSKYSTHFPEDDMRFR